MAVEVIRYEIRRKICFTEFFERPCQPHGFVLYPLPSFRFGSLDQDKLHVFHSSVHLGKLLSLKEENIQPGSLATLLFVLYQFYNDRVQV